MATVAGFDLEMLVSSQFVSVGCITDMNGPSRKVEELSNQCINDTTVVKRPGLLDPGTVDFMLRADDFDTLVAAQATKATYSWKIVGPDNYEDAFDAWVSEVTPQYKPGDDLMAKVVLRCIE